MRVTNAISITAVSTALLLRDAVVQSREDLQHTCCEMLAVAGLTVHHPLSNTYAEREADYFYANFQLGPWCIVQPTSTNEVSTAIKVLTTTSKCPFAVRSGGRGTGSNIAEGVTIDLGSMKSVAYHRENRTLSTQAGARWRDVYAVTDKTGVAVAGGRHGEVGVAGLLVGGGIPFSLARHGFACDSVRQFEVVLANGEIVLADREQHSGLFAALKGGSSNFGIVTRIDLEIVDTSKLWAGVVFYPNTHDMTAALTDALVTFADSIDSQGVDDASSLICQIHPTGASELSWFGQYANIDGVEWGQSQKSFWALQNNSILSTLRQTNYTSLVGDLQLDLGMQVIWFTRTFKSNTGIMRKAAELHEMLSEEMTAEFGRDFESMSLFQPLPAKLDEVSKAKGGNVLGLDRITETRILWLASLHIKDPKNADKAQEKVAQWVAQVDAYAKSLGLLDEFLYLNYANYLAQDPLASYGEENLKKIAHVAKQYDPEGVFQYQTPGGFKISKSYAGYDKLEAIPIGGHDEL